MEIAKLSNKGQITIPIAIRQALNLSTGDKIVIQEENGRFYFDNANLVAFSRIQDDFKGEAKKQGYKSVEDMEDVLLAARKDVRGY